MASCGQEGGGFLWNSKNDDKLLLAAKEGNIQVIHFMVNNDMVDDYKSKDAYGNTILHHLASYADTSNKRLVRETINNILEKHTYLVNYKNKRGETPISVAVKNNFYQAINLLTYYGADLSLEDKQGYVVDLGCMKKKKLEDVRSAMRGGGKKKDKSSKKISKGKSTKQKRVLMKRRTELSRLIENEQTKIHKEVIQIAMDLLDISELDAKIVKAALWRMVREKYPDMKSQLDKAVTMKKLATKAIMKKINIDKVRKDIEAHYASKKDDA